MFSNSMIIVLNRLKISKQEQKRTIGKMSLNEQHLFDAFPTFIYNNLFYLCKYLNSLFSIYLHSVHKTNLYPSHSMQKPSPPPPSPRFRTLRESLDYIYSMAALPSYPKFASLCQKTSPHLRGFGLNSAHPPKTYIFPLTTPAAAEAQATFIEGRVLHE